MRSPAELQSKLRRNWEHAALRESRLLGLPGVWPWTLSIGNPSSRRIRDQLDDVKRHLERWRQVNVGKVLWEQVVYRHVSQPVGIPVAWQLDKPSEWIEAIGDPRIRAEFRDMLRDLKDELGRQHEQLATQLSQLNASLLNRRRPSNDV